MSESTRLFDVHELPIEDVRPDPNQPREQMRGIDELAASMTRYGQLTPILVKRVGEVYRIIGGERRWTAAKQAGLTTILARIAETEDEEVALIELADNLHDPLTDIERSRGIQRAFDYDVPVSDVAAASGVRAELLEKAREGYRVAKPFYGDEYEPTTIDRFIAIAEFAGDKDAVERLEKASENEVAFLTSKLRREAKMAEEYARAEQVVADSGVTRIPDDDYRHVGYIGRGWEKPEDAAYAKITRTEWQGTADITWYAEADENEHEAKMAAKREEYDRLVAEFEAASKARREFVVAHLSGNGAVVVKDTLRDFAEKAWEDGVPSDSAWLEDDEEFGSLTASRPRMLGAIIACFEGDAVRFIVSARPNSYYIERDSSQVLAYYEALAGIGYTPCDAEKAALAALEGDGDEA